MARNENPGTPALRSPVPESNWRKKTDPIVASGILAQEPLALPGLTICCSRPPLLQVRATAEECRSERQSTKLAQRRRSRRAADRYLARATLLDSQGEDPDL